VIFRPDLAAKVLSGEKTVTRRLASDNPRSPWWRGGCALEPGRRYAVQPGRGRAALGRVEVAEAALEPLGHLTDAEARREGFPDALAFCDAWIAINGQYRPGALVWRVELRGCEG
jgi:hypothetical protein